MNRAGWSLVLALALGGIGSAVAQPLAEGGPVQLRLKQGDDPRWAATDFDDRDWPVVKPDAIPARSGIFWLRFRVARGCADAVGNVGRGYSYAWPADAEIDSIFMGAIFSFELYWDGHPLERSGVVGNSHAEEIAGPLDHLIRIPDALRGPGEHLIALRISDYHYNFREAHFPLSFSLNNYTERLKTETRRPVFPLMGIAGALIMAAVGSVLFRFAERRRTLLLCNLLSVALAVFYFLVALRWLHNGPYDWHAPRLKAVGVAMAVVAVLLPWILLEQFAVPRRGRWLAGVVLVVIGVWFFGPYFEEPKALFQCRVMLAISTLISGWAVRHKRTGAWVVFVSMLIGLFVVQSSPRVFLDPTFFVVFEGLVLSVFAALGAQVQEDRRRTREALLTASRLEVELLKKNIQPHFLLNTLAAVQETIEQEPRTAVALVDALAGEFRILSRVAGEKLVPLGQELELCREHLAVMSLRKGARCTLTVNGADERALVPPALFHTLIENGLTHLMPRDGEQRFELSVEPRPAGVRYTLVVHGEPVERAGGRSRGEGTGLRYIKARLEESFAGRWILQGEPIVGGWRTVIQWQDQAGEARG